MQQAPKRLARNDQAAAKITTRESFINANRSMSGIMQPSMASPGRLPREHQDALMDAAETAPDFYVVYSYQTPIAYFAFGNWIIPAVRYSPTTSRHQSIVRRAAR